MKRNNYEQNKKKYENKTEILEKSDTKFTCKIQNENGFKWVVEVYSLSKLLERFN